MNNVQFLDLTSNRLDQMQIRDILSRLGLSDSTSLYKVILFDSEQNFNNINHHIKRSKGLILIAVSDEASNFPYQKLYLGNYKLYIQTPNQFLAAHVNARFFGCGYGHANLFYKSENKEYDMSFLGQVTHDRRHMAVRAMKQLSDKYNTYLLETEGFTLGVPEDEYFDIMARSKIVVCPSGVVTQDSLRFYEALELGSIPIPDAVSPVYGYSEYWSAVAPNFPVEPYRTKTELIERIEDVLNNYDRYQEEVSAWWAENKELLETNLKSDIEEIIQNGETGNNS